jgi:hypothetical protein
MKRWIALALVSCATLTHAQSTPAKKELVNRLLALQQPGIEGMARNIAERPALALMQQAGAALQTVPADKREATAKSIDADLKKYVEETTPYVRDRAVKLGPTTVAPIMEEKFSEDELKQLIAWFESPVKKKYEQIGPDLQSAMVPKLLAEAAPTVDPKIAALQMKITNTLRAAGADIGPPQAAKPTGPAAKPAAKAASK